jgi:hypothetical protein
MLVLVVTEGDRKRKDLLAGINRSTVTSPFIEPPADTGATLAVASMLVERKVRLLLSGMSNVLPFGANVPVIYNLLARVTVVRDSIVNLSKTFVVASSVLSKYKVTGDVICSNIRPDASLPINLPVPVRPPPSMVKVL